MSLQTPDLTYDVTNWALGYVDSPDASAVKKGGTAAAANCFFTSLGEPSFDATALKPRGSCKLSKRAGARLLNPTCISAGKRVDGLYEFRREGVAAGELLAVCDGLLKKWDGSAPGTMTAIADLAMAASSAVELSTFRNLCFVMNGTIMKCYDGTSVLDVGFVAPTAAPAIAAVGPAGAGVTGTYQALATWYDSTHDHESSPTAMGTATVFAAQDRQHTKPTGSPPGNVDKWRIYVRRTDTNEIYFKLVAETAIGTATATEAVTDSTRNLASTLLAPLPNVNDVPPVFAFMANGQGYRFGVQVNDSYVWVSALGDPQSQHPKDKLGVNRGDGQAITTVKAAGDRIIAQKGRKTFELVGDRMPFVPKDLNSSFGNHSQSSSVEGAGKYWAWDDERGPYVTDLGAEWTSLVDGRISRIFATVNRGAEIRCAHFKEQTLVCWIVATGSSTRQRAMLAYNYLVGAWLPPIYGIEYGSITTFQLSDGTVKLFVGDQWGRVYQYFIDAIEGVPGGTITAPVTAATASTVTCAAAAFYTTADGLKGMPVGVLDPSGRWQFRTIASNTGTAITIDVINGSAWTSTPDTTYVVVVGAIDWFWTSPLVTFDLPIKRKRAGYLYGELRASGSASATVLVRVRFDDAAAPVTVTDSLMVQSSGLWGTGLWGTMRWGSGNKQPYRRRLAQSFYGVQLELSNRYPNQPVELVTVGVSADLLRGRMAA